MPTRPRRSWPASPSTASRPGAWTSAPVSGTNLPGTSLQLLYSSLAAYPVVTFIYRYQLDPTRPVPPTIHAALTLNGTTGNTVWYNTALLNPGDIVEIPLQGDATAL